MNGIFVADLVVYLLLLPIALYICFKHGQAGFLPWYFFIIFCGARIAGGALGVHDNHSLAANILQSVGFTPIILGADGMVHEARLYRNPNHSRVLDWSVVAGISGLMIAALALSITGALNVYQNRYDASSEKISMWQAGSAMMVAIWALEVLWCAFSLSPSQNRGTARAYQGGSTLLQGTLIAHIFVGIRVIYTLVAVATQRSDLSPVTGKIAIRVVLMFLPEVLAIMVFLAIGLRTRNLRELI